MGLNYSSPISYKEAGIDLTEVMYWTRQRIPGRSTQYRRPAIKIDTVRGLLIMEGRKGVGFYHNKVTVAPGGTQPPIGTEVTVCIEIMDDHFERHEVPFNRCPTVGPFRDWERSFRLGMRIEWKEKDEPKYMWLQSGTAHEVIPAGAGMMEPGAHRPYAKTMSMIRYLEQTILTGMPTWYYDYGKVARILDVQFEYLTQTWHLTEILPGPSRQYDAAQNTLSKAEIIAKLNAAGFPFIAHQAAHLRPPPTGGPRRKNCDRCAGGRGPPQATGWPWANRALPNCNLTPVNLTCEACLSYGLECTWTETADLFASESMLNAVVCLPRSSIANVVRNDVDLRIVHG